MNREKKYVIAYNKKHFQVSHNCENRLQWLSTQIIPCLQYFLYATNTQSGVRTLLESRVIGLCELSTRIYWLNVKTNQEMETNVDSLKALPCHPDPQEAPGSAGGQPGLWWRTSLAGVRGQLTVTAQRRLSARLVTVTGPPSNKAPLTQAARAQGRLGAQPGQWPDTCYIKIKPDIGGQDQTPPAWHQRETNNEIVMYLNIINRGKHFLPVWWKNQKAPMTRAKIVGK